jgi:hypothetical protein
MAITATLKKQWLAAPGGRLFVHLGLVFSGTYPTGGDTLNLQGLGIQSNHAPASWAAIEGQALGANGTQYVWIQGTTQANGKVGVTQGAGVEVAAGAYPASVTGDVVNALFYFDFDR